MNFLYVSFQPQSLPESCIGNQACLKNPLNNMHHMGMMGHFKKMQEKFDIKKDVSGDKLTITFSGSKEDIAKLDKKMEAMKVMMEDCCEEGSCC